MTALTEEKAVFLAFGQVAAPDLWVYGSLLGQYQFAWLPLTLLVGTRLWLTLEFQLQLLFVLMEM